MSKYPRAEMDYSEEAALFSVLAKPRCLHILTLLRDHGELYGREILYHFDTRGVFFEQATLAQYLAILVQAGLITYRVGAGGESNRHYYAIVPERITAIMKYLASFLAQEMQVAV